MTTPKEASLLYTLAVIREAIPLLMDKEQRKIARAIRKVANIKFGVCERCGGRFATRDSRQRFDTPTCASYHRVKEYQARQKRKQAPPTVRP